jgi:predicted transcriptional regulator
MLGQTVHINYYGKGYKRINSQRVVQEEQVMTLSAEPTITYPSIDELIRRLEELEQEVKSLKEQLNSSESE